ncbi:hypothetical protein SRHO_G00030470 [Serrasalmus rhombeus]
MLADIVEKIKEARLQAAPPARYISGPEDGDVECDFCTGQKQKACSSCLKQVVESQRNYQERIQERDRELQELRKAVDIHKRSAQAAVQDSERIFTELISSIERKRSEVSELIRAQEKAAVSRAEGHLWRLEQEIAELRRRDAELEQLSHSEDHMHFLQSFQSLLAPSGSEDVPTITVSSHLSFEEVAKSVSQIKEKLEELWKEEFKKASVEVKQVHIIPPPEPQNREDFLEYFCQLTLDPKTANNHLHLSEGNTVVTCNHSVQSYPDHPERYWVPHSSTHPTGFPGGFLSRDRDGIES